MTGKTIILSAGGTGGHLFPALATAELLYKQGHRPILISDDRTRHFHYPEWLQRHHLQLSSPHPSGKIINIIKSLRQVRHIMKPLKADAVIGFGGYPSMPAVAYAVLTRTKLILHEQNRYLGRTHRLAARFARAIALSFPDTQGIEAKYSTKTTFTGNPVRQDIKLLHNYEYHPPKESQKFELLIVGGSLGAQLFSEVIPAAIRRLPEELRKKLHVTQQCREAEASMVAQHYKDWNISVEIQPFFNDMAKRLQAAHLVISRAGASSVTEMMMSARPAIYVPLAIAADNHQTLNAQYMEANNAGWLLSQSQFEFDTLAARLEFCMTNPTVLLQTSNAARGLAELKASEKLVGLVI